MNNTFTLVQFEYADVWKDCCSYGMVPATIESKAEINCLIKDYQKQNGNYLFPTYFNNFNACSVRQQSPLLLIALNMNQCKTLQCVHIKITIIIFQTYSSD
jgi:hypothetical protein